MRSFQLPGRSTAHGVNGMCATSSPLATMAGVDMLRQGGNAVDAAVTMSAVLLITEPHMTGIGGDCFALIGREDGSLTGLNGSGRAAMAADGDWLRGSSLSEISETNIHAITVPGAIDAWDRLLKDHGSVTLGDALAPAISLAEGGVAVTPRVANDWAGCVELLRGDAGGQQHYLNNGHAFAVGEKFTSPALAQTLRLIGERGRDSFYEGEIAEKLVACLGAKGSLLTMDDFAATEASYVTPISTGFQGHDIFEIPPNGQGVTALIMLNILSRFDLGSLDPAGIERTHLQIEAARLAYELRDRHVADPEKASVPVEYMLSDDLADQLAGRIDPKRAISDIPLAVGPKYTDTIYLTVVDKDRTAVSFINSIFHSFGSGVCEPQTGIMLQNRGSCFVTDPDHPNCIGPGKRPLHTIIPGMIRQGGKITMPFGVMGGAYQPMGHAQVAVNLMTYGMDIQEAIDFPRFFPEGGVVDLEEAVAGAVLSGLTDMGHTVARATAPLGGGQGIFIDRANGTLVGGADPRKDSLAMGY
jgi:gamma-glutamyltranspeptidase/glutathione hydrolase